MPELAITLDQFETALREAVLLDDEQLRSASGAGLSRSYFVRREGRDLPMKAVLRLAYRRARIAWDGPQSKIAAGELRARFEVVHILPRAETERLKRQRASAERWMRDGNFRSAVLDIYGARCLITGCDVLEAIDAAHIVGVADEGDDNPRNGIVLRSDLHRLFDAYLMSIDPTNGTVALHPDCQQSYGDYQGQHVALPARGPQLTDFTAHFRSFREAAVE